MWHRCVVNALIATGLSQFELEDRNHEPALPPALTPQEVTEKRAHFMEAWFDKTITFVFTRFTCGQWMSVALEVGVRMSSVMFPAELAKRFSLLNSLTNPHNNLTRTRKKSVMK